MRARWDLIALAFLVISLGIQQFMQFRALSAAAEAQMLAIPGDQSMLGQIWENIIHFRGSGIQTMGMETLFNHRFAPVFYLTAPLYACAKWLVGVPDASNALHCFVIFAGNMLALGFAYRVARIRQPLLILSFGLLLAVSTPLNHLAAVGTRDSAFALPAVFLMIIGWERQRALLFLLGMVVLLTIREDYGLVCAGFLLIAWRRKPIWWALPSLGLLAMIVIVLVVMPQFQEHPIGFGRFAHLGSNITQVVLSPLQKPGVFFATLLSPGNILFVFHLLLSVGFVALLRPRLLAPTAFYMVLLCLNNDAIRPAASVHLWYVAPLVPFVFAATAYGIASIQHLPRRAGVRLAFALLLVPTYLFFAKSPAVKSMRAQGTDRSAGAELRHARAMIPRTAPVATLMNHSPFFTEHRNLTWLNQKAQTEGSYVVLPITLANTRDYHGMSPQEFTTLVREFSKRNQARLIWRGKLIAVWRPTKATNGRQSTTAIFTPGGFLEAETTTSSYLDDDLNTVLRTPAGPVHVRAVGGRRTWSPLKRARGIAMIAPPHSFGQSARLVLIAKRKLPGRCCAKGREPRLVMMFPDGRSVVRPFQCNTDDKFIRLRFDFKRPAGSGDTPGVPMIQYRSCGIVYVDKLRLVSAP